MQFFLEKLQVFTEMENMADALNRNRSIREGNALFNAGKIEQAAQIFRATNYKDGLIRVGDHFYLEKHQPLRAYGFYRAAGDTSRMQRIQDGFIFALRCWLDDSPDELNTKPAAENSNKPASEKETGIRVPGKSI